MGTETKVGKGSGTRGRERNTLGITVPVPTRSRPDRTFATRPVPLARFLEGLIPMEYAHYYLLVFFRFCFGHWVCVLLLVDLDSHELVVTIYSDEREYNNKDIQPVIRAIGVSHTACKDEFRQKLLSHSAGVYLNLYQ